MPGSDEVQRRRRTDWQEVKNVGINELVARLDERHTAAQNQRIEDKAHTEAAMGELRRLVTGHIAEAKAAWEGIEKDVQQINGKIGPLLTAAGNRARLSWEVLIGLLILFGLVFAPAIQHLMGIK